jgi:hypothetical protein
MVSIPWMISVVAGPNPEHLVGAEVGSIRS